MVGKLLVHRIVTSEGSLRVDDLRVIEPAAAGESVPAVTQPIPIVTSTERCAQCAAPLAHDQRYCLQCGEPRPHLAGPPGAKSAGESLPSSKPPTPSAPPGISPAATTGPSTTRNNSLALMAGVGLLLLAMGVGVLIGRAGAGSAKAPPAQVISLGAAAGAGTNPASTTPSTTPTTETSAASSKEKTEAKTKVPAGTGSSITKPASASALKSPNQAKESGQSYEQKSKNLPDVVLTK